jgi:O-methyltransferase
MLGQFLRKIKNLLASEKEFKILPWNEDGVFLDIMAKIRDFTIVDPVRCYMIYQLGKQASNIEGDIAEVGVYKGGTAKLLACIFRETWKEIYLFDTFQGMPLTDPEKDLHQEGDFNDTSLEQVASYLSEFKNVHLYKGIFPETADAIRAKSFSIVHLDVDIYSSVYSSTEFFYPRMAKGGILIFDDYGFKSCPGAKQAVDVFFKTRPEVPWYLPTGQAIVIKI